MDGAGEPVAVSTMLPRWHAGGHPEPLRPGGLVLPVKIDPEGVRGPTRGQARGPAWTALGRGWFVPASAPDVVEQRIAEAAAYLPAGGAVSGWAACRMHGASFFDGLARDGRTPLPVPLVVGPGAGTRKASGVVISRDRVDPAEVMTVHGVACTTRLRAVFDAVRWAPGGREAVVALDSATAGRVTSIGALAAYAASRQGWRGVDQVRTALALGSERVRSPAETRLRLIWTHDAGLPPPLVNWAVADSTGRFLAEVDLLDPVLGLVGEYDGADHRSGARHAADVRREDALRRAGLEYVTVTGADLARPAALVGRILAAKERALLIPRSRRTFLIKKVAQRPLPRPD